jgi:flagellar basal body P-ring formation protein FlgA
VLQPGEALDHGLADQLLAGDLARAMGADDVRVGVRQPSLPLANPYRDTAELRVDDLRLLPNGGFAARVAIHVGSAAPLFVTLEGDVVRMVAIPLPVRALPAGAFVAAADLTTRLFPEDRIRPDWILDADDAVGMEARRLLMEGRPIETAAIVSPQMVRRGDPVRLRFERGGLMLEAPGRAEADGAMGSAIPARNAATGAVVRGVVVGPRTLLVEAAR